VRPESNVWRKESRRDRRGRRRQTGTNSPNSAKLLRRVYRFHEARLQGLTVEGAAELLNISQIDAWRMEDLIATVADERAEWLR
jgi:hypothetical protein